MILFLGGSNGQVPALQLARKMGLEVIVADYLSENPGRLVADKYYEISTVNKEEILELARFLNIDAISAYASDPASATAAYVSDSMGLVGNSFSSAKILSDKGIFRKFLIEEGFFAPWFEIAVGLDELLKKNIDCPGILKPVDSSGSKGVFIINTREDLIKYFPEAISFSVSKRVILEQLIEKSGPQVHGEGLVVNGEVVFLHLGDQTFSKFNPVAPCSTLVPSVAHRDIMPELILLVKDVIKRIGFVTGGINIEIIRDVNDRLFLLEIGGRSGGNFMPQLMFQATGFDLTKANIDILFNIPVKKQRKKITKSHFAQLILYSRRDGHLKGIDIPNHEEIVVVFQKIYYSTGELIRAYRNSRDVVGVLIIEIRDNEALNFYYDKLLDHDFVMVL